MTGASLSPLGWSGEEDKHKRSLIPVTIGYTNLGSVFMGVRTKFQPLLFHEFGQISSLL